MRTVNLACGVDANDWIMVFHSLYTKFKCFYRPDDANNFILEELRIVDRATAMVLRLGVSIKTTRLAPEVQDEPG